MLLTIICDFTEGGVEVGLDVQRRVRAERDVRGYLSERSKKWALSGSDNRGAALHRHG